MAHEKFDVLHTLVSAVQHNVNGIHLIHIDFHVVFLYENWIAFESTKLNKNGTVYSANMAYQIILSISNHQSPLRLSRS